MGFMGFIIFFYGLMVAANGAKILYPNNFWGLIFWCILATLWLSAFLSDDKEATKRHILTPTQKAKKDQTLFVDKEVLRTCGAVNFTHYLQSEHRLPKEINPSCAEKITYRCVEDRMIAKIPGAINNTLNSNK